MLGSLVTLLYRTAMSAAAPAGVPPGHQGAMDTLGEAVALAPSLPPELGAPLLAAARTAFTRAVEVTFVVCALIALGAAGLIMWLLRRLVADQGPDASPTAGIEAPGTEARPTALVS